MKKIFLVLGFGFFVSDVINGVLLSLFGQGYQALRLNHKREVFCSSY